MTALVATLLLVASPTDATPLDAPVVRAARLLSRLDVIDRQTPTYEFTTLAPFSLGVLTGLVGTGLAVANAGWLHVALFMMGGVAVGVLFAIVETIAAIVETTDRHHALARRRALISELDQLEAEDPAVRSLREDHPGVTPPSLAHPVMLASLGAGGTLVGVVMALTPYGGLLAGALIGVGVAMGLASIPSFVAVLSDRATRDDFRRHGFPN